jgi:hypothetical protein
MRPSEIVELAALVATHGRLLIHAGGPIPLSNLERYWTASKYRADAWSRALKRHATTSDDSRQQAALRGLSSVESVVEEILAADVLTRVWTAVLCGHDRARGMDEVEPIGRSVFISHMEARQRALNLVLHAPGVSVEQAVALNRLRQRTERWIDLLLGRVMLDYDASEFAVDPARAQEFCRDLREHAQPQSSQAWNLLLSSLRMAFRGSTADACPSAGLNEQIAGSILGCFQPEMFDSTGLFRSLWTVRLLNATSDAHGMIETLFHPEPPEARSELRRWR